MYSIQSCKNRGDADAYSEPLIVKNCLLLSQNNSTADVRWVQNTLLRKHVQSKRKLSAHY